LLVRGASDCGQDERRRRLVAGGTTGGLDRRGGAEVGSGLRPSVWRPRRGAEPAAETGSGDGKGDRGPAAVNRVSGSTSSWRARVLLVLAARVFSAARVFPVAPSLFPSLPPLASKFHQSTIRKEQY